MPTVLAMIDQEIEAAKTALAAFTKALADDPVSAFEWSQDTFRAAADLRVLSTVRKRLATDSVAAVRALAQGQVNRLAGRGSSSTQAPQNLMRDEIMSAWARALHILSAGDKP